MFLENQPKEIFIKLFIKGDVDLISNLSISHDCVFINLIDDLELYNIGLKIKKNEIADYLDFKFS